MTVLNQVKELQGQGMQEEDIIQALRENGISELEINQALEQSKIKAAVGEGYENQEEPFPQEQQEAMQPSMMAPAPQPENYSPVQQEQQAPAQEEQYMYPTPQPYSQGYQEYQPYQENSTETISEISEQIAEEKLSRLKQEIGNIAVLKSNIERKTKDLDERLKRIEEIIDRLQAGIMGRIGMYGENIQDIKKEMQLMQESFSKALPHYERKSSEDKIISKQVKKTPSKKQPIDNYLRR